MLDALIIAPHPDDAEISMGGTILRMMSDGMQIGILDLTNGEPTPHGSPQIRAEETAAANRVLGDPWRDNLGLANREVVATLEARAAVANVVRRVQPRWLFAPYATDAHPDHVAAAQLAEDARFWAKLTKSDLQGKPHHPEKIFYYFSIHLKLAIQPDFVVDISDEWPAKQATLECYQSQLVVGRDDDRRPPIQRLEIQAAYWGEQIGRLYGEPFAGREPIGLKSLVHLL